MNKAWGSRELTKCVECLGFTFKRQTRHLIFTPPRGKISTTISKNILPIKGGVKSFDPNSRARYISQIKSFHITKQEIESCFE